MKHKIFLIDDHPIVREGLQILINAQKDMMVCGEAENANEVFEKLKESKPNAIILDLSLKEVNGLELIKQIKTTFLVPILILSMHDEKIYTERVLQMGADGYIGKNQPPKKIIAALHTILKGEIYVSQPLVSHLLNKFVKGNICSSPLDSLTNREFEIFQLLGQSLTTHAIAKKLYISVKTVETHRSNIKEKLGTKNIHELMMLARDLVGAT